MTTTYYSVSGAPATSSAGSSATMRSEFALIEAGFALLPSLTSAGNRIPHINSGSTAQTTTSGFTFDGTTFTAPAMSSTGVMTLGGALTYGGVTLSNSVTGTGSMMLSASPTTTGTLTAAAITASGNGSFGPGGSASAQTTITANGSSANTYGPGIYLQRNSVSKGVLATESQLAANNSDNIWLYAYAGASLKLYGGGNLGQTIDASGNVSMPGTLGVTGTATMAAINASGALTLTASGALQLNITPATTTSYALTTYTNAGSTVQMGVDSSTGGGFGRGNYSAVIYSSGSNIVLMANGGSKSVRIDAGGTTDVGVFASTGLSVTGTLGVGDITTNGNNKGLYFNGTRNGILGSNAADTVSIAAANANVAVFGAASTSLTGTLGVTSYATTDAYFWSKGVGAAGGLFLGSGGSSNGQISQASAGSSSITTYIGNQSITTISDARLKDNIVPTTRNALDLLNQWEIVDHTWNDPSDQCENNRNMRGVWTGAIAQQVQPITPWLVNKPLTDVDENGEINTWSVDYGYAVPLLVKAIQELAADFQAYKAAHP